MEKNPASAKKTGPGREPYIVEKEDVVSYLGVEVPKGEGGPLVPSRQESANYFYTEEDYTLRREIAMSVTLNKPILFEGGTGIGKTSAVAAMCAELNTNFCKVSFARDMAIEDIIGGKTITKDEEGREAVKWYDGNLMLAVRHGGIALLDEYNFQGSKVGSRVNPIIDAILNGRKEITLPENDNERVIVHPNFRLVAAQNPPGTEEGQEFTGREQLSAETFGRWTYNKLPLEMSRPMRDKRLAGMMGELVDIKVPEAEFRKLGEGVPLRELKDIPGMTHWRRAALDILDQLKSDSTGADRKMARGQRQKLYFNARLEQGLLNYVSRFYRGDANEVWREAFEHLVVGMYRDEEDRSAVRELISINAYAPQTETKRVPLESETAPEVPFGTEFPPPSTGEGLSAQEAEKLFGKDFLGPKVAEQIFGRKVEGVGNIPFSKAELERAKQLGQQLIYYTDELLGKSTKKGAPLTLESLKEKFAKAHDGAPMFFTQDWYNSEKFFKTQKPRKGWRLTSKDLVPGTTSKNFVEQTDALVVHLQKDVFKGMKLPKQYKDAIVEWQKKKAEIEPLATSSKDAERKRGSQMLADLAITNLTRELPVEVMYRFILNDQKNKEKPLPSTYTWTATRASDGTLVYVGFFDEDGASVNRDDPVIRLAHLGSSFSRR